jgi:aminoglycoside phosphotransferase (APT) family kinase protein
MKNPQSYFPVSRFGAVKMVTPVTAGLSGAGTYAVTTDSGEFFLRIPAAGVDDLSWMIAAQRLAADRGVAPQIISVDEETGAVVSAKARGEQLGIALRQPDVRARALRGVAEALAALHGISAPDFRPLDTSLGQAVWDEQSARTGFPDWARPLGKCVSLGLAALASDARRVLSHNDANPANLLWDGSKICLVDWERAALAHPYVDLATVSNFVNLSDDDAVGLLAVQERAEITAEQRATFIVLRNFLRVVYGAIFLRLAPDLAAIGFQGRDQTPTLAECYVMMGKGELNPMTPLGQAQLGAGLFRQVPV